MKDFIDNHANAVILILIIVVGIIGTAIYNKLVPDDEREKLSDYEIGFSDGYSAAEDDIIIPDTDEIFRSGYEEGKRDARPDEYDLKIDAIAEAVHEAEMSSTTGSEEYTDVFAAAEDIVSYFDGEGGISWNQAKDAAYVLSEFYWALQ